MSDHEHPACRAAIGRAPDAAPVRFSVDDLIRSARRRRRTRIGGAGVLAAGAVAGLAVGVPQLLPGGHHHAPPGHSPSVARERSFTCGQELAQPLVTRSVEGIAMTVTHVRHTTAGPPEVDIQVTAAHPETVWLPPGPTPLRYVVLHAGRIVAGNDLTASSPNSRPSLNAGVQQQVTISPNRPFTTALHVGADQICGPTRWGQLWAHANEYQVAVVMSQPDGTGRVGHDPLLIAQAQLGPQ